MLIKGVVQDSLINPLPCFFHSSEFHFDSLRVSSLIVPARDSLKTDTSDKFISSVLTIEKLAVLQQAIITAVSKFICYQGLQVVLLLVFQL